MSYLATYGKEIVSLLIPLLTIMLNRMLRSKAKLDFASPHNFTFLVQEPLRNAEGEVIRAHQTVHTSSLYVTNSGRETATNVEIVYNWKPILNIWPPRKFSEHLNDDQRYVLQFESLAPGESVGCESMTINADLPRVVVVRCDQCRGTEIEMYPQRVFSRAVRILVGWLLIAGAAASIYLAIILLQALIVRTPLFGAS